MTKTPKERLEYLRGELRDENISYGEMAELESLKEFIEPGDVELLEAAGVPESSYSIEKDHAEIKKQIKQWEIELDALVDILSGCKNYTLVKNGYEVTLNIEILRDGLEELSHEMMVVNM